MRHSSYSFDSSRSNFYLFLTVKQTPKDSGGRGAKTFSMLTNNFEEVKRPEMISSNFGAGKRNDVQNFV
jgi:hypothetical protein